MNDRQFCESALGNVGCQAEGDTISIGFLQSPSSAAEVSHTGFLTCPREHQKVVMPIEKKLRTSDGLTEQERLEIKQTLKLVYPDLAIS